MEYALILKIYQSHMSRGVFSGWIHSTIQGVQYFGSSNLPNALVPHKRGDLRISVLTNKNDPTIQQNNPILQLIHPFQHQNNTRNSYSTQSASCLPPTQRSISSQRLLPLRKQRRWRRPRRRHLPLRLLYVTNRLRNYKHIYLLKLLNI